MKKIAITLIIMAMATSFVSCGNGNKDNTSADKNISTNTENNDENKPSTEIETDDKKGTEENNKEDNKESNAQSNEAVNGDSEVSANTSVGEKAQSEPQEVSKNYRLFFYDGVEDNIYYKDTIVTVIDKAVTKALTNGLKDSQGENFLAIPSNVEVLSAELDNDSITVNLSGNYYDFSSTLGSGAEIGMLKSLALTYSYNYNVSKVRILIDGKNYTSGHITYGDNDYININEEAKPL